MKNIKEFNEALDSVFKIKVLPSSTSHYLKYDVNGKEVKLKRKRIRDAILSLKSQTIDNEVELFSEKQFEVSAQNPRRTIFFRDEEVTLKDPVNKINYILSSPSDAYLIFIIKKFHEVSDNERDRGHFSFRLRNYGRHYRLSDEDDNNYDLIDLIKYATKLSTVQIHSESKKSKDDFETLMYSFLFNISYNTDNSFLPSSSLESLTRRIRIKRLRRSELSDIEPPKLNYENDLILFYQKGISTESVDLQYLSFYHILEHFFEKIYNDVLTKSIKTELTRPSFSYKRNKDINHLIKVIQEKLKYKNEEFQINEPEALKLVIDRFVPNFELIKNEIEIYDPSLINHYKRTEISFSKGNKVNFDDDRDVILKNLQERIYKTRNSIVHSKETDKSRYLPFKHDRVLQDEIILVRIIAERIIIESSKEM